MGSMFSFDRNQTFYKITNLDENHRGYQYKDGINILDKPFEKKGTCVKGGIYFTTKKHLHHFYSYGVWIREVTIPPDAQIVKDPDTNIIKYRADKIILGKRTPLYDSKTKEIYPWLITKNVNFLNNGLGYACQHGHLEIANWCVEKGANNLNDGLSCACEEGHVKMAEFCVEKGADDFHRALLNAHSSGNLELAKWCIEKSRLCLNGTLSVCCFRCYFLHENGEVYINIMKWCIEMGATKCNECNGKYHIFKN